MEITKIVCASVVLIILIETTLCVEDVKSIVDSQENELQEPSKQSLETDKKEKDLLLNSTESTSRSRPKFRIGRTRYRNTRLIGHPGFAGYTLGHRFRDSGFRGARLGGTGFRGSSFRDTGFRGSRFRSTGFRGSRNRGSGFRGSRFSDCRSRFSDSGSRFSESRSRYSNSGPRFSDSRSRFSDSRSRFSDSGPRSSDSGSKVSRFSDNGSREFKDNGLNVTEHENTTKTVTRDLEARRRRLIAKY